MLVFVYGTLKKGYSNHRLIDHAKFVGKAVTIDGMGVTGVYFPYAHPFGGDITQRLPLVGEVYDVDSDTLAKLDWLEGVPTHYVRSKVTVSISSTLELVEVYMYIPSNDTMDHLGFDTMKSEWVVDFRGTDAIEWGCRP